MMIDLARKKVVVRHLIDRQSVRRAPESGELCAVACFLCGLESHSANPYWARWPLTGEIILLMAVALPVYAYYQRKQG